MERLLEQQDSVQLFSQYCNKKMCTENLSFWQEVQQFKNSEEAERFVLAPQLISKYIKEGSEYQVNLDEPVVQQIQADIEQGNIPSDLFTQAEQSVLLLMEMDVLPGYQRWKKQLDKEANLKIAGFPIIETWSHKELPKNKKLARKITEERRKLCEAQEAN